MQFRELTKNSQVENIGNESREYPNGILIFKHSTRCAISSMAFDRMKRKWRMDDNELPVYYLDILRHRDLSRAVADKFDVRHESPQVLLIKDGKCAYHASHHAIQPEAIEEEALDA